MKKITQQNKWIKSCFILIFIVSNKINAQDIISGGTNSWIFHTPDDGRKTLYIAPGNNSTGWEWNKQTQFLNDGSVTVSANLDVANTLTTGNIKTGGRMHISGEENLYLLNKGGVFVSSAWGGNGNLSVDGTINTGNIKAGGRMHISGEENLYLLNKGGVFVSSAWGGNGNLSVDGTLTSGNINSGGRMHISGPELLYLLNKEGVVIGKEWGGNGNLTVQGSILTSRVKVAVPNGANWNWADYVFEHNYKLKPLQDVEAYIKENKHLEGMPTTEEVKKDGIDMAPVTTKLLEKIEELTLYTIELKKEIELLKKK